MSTGLTNAPRQELSRALEHVEVEEKLFELAQRKAKVYANSSLVPKEYQNNIGNVLIADNMARRMGADTLMVMQNLYIVHNRPGWSAQFLIATFNSNGRFTAIKYEFSGTAGKDDWGCTAFTKEIATEDVIRGTTITWAMAKKEGWVEKNGSKWRTMPEQMMRYRAATFLIRATAPEIGMGLMTKEELEDITVDELPRLSKSSLDSLADRLLGEKEPATGETNDNQPQAPGDSHQETGELPPSDDNADDERAACFAKLLGDFDFAMTRAQFNAVDERAFGPEGREWSEAETQTLNNRREIAKARLRGSEAKKQQEMLPTNDGVGQ